MSSSPDSEIAAIDEGAAHQKAGRLDHALRCYARAARAADPRIVAEALRRQSSVLRQRARWEEAIDAARASGELAERAGLADLVVEAVHAEATVYQARGAFAEAVRLFERVLSLPATPRVHASAHQNLGAIAAAQGDFASARPRFHAAATGFRRAGYAFGEATVYNNFGRAALDHGRFQLADDLLRQAAAAARDVADRDLVALVMMNQAEARLGLERPADALPLAEEALEQFMSAGHVSRQIECLRVIGDVMRAQGDHASAVACYEHACQLAEENHAEAEIAKLRPRLAPPGARE